MKVEMGEYRCPECGRLNPAGVIHCEYCQALILPFEKESPFAERTDDRFSIESQFQKSGGLEETEPTDKSFRLSSSGKSGLEGYGGPLAGLQGTLEPVSSFVRPKKGPSQPIELKVTASQRANADLFKHLIDTEGQPLPVATKSRFSFHQLLRWGIASLIIFFVIWPIISESREMPLPTYQAEIAEVNRLVNELPNNAHVLISFDYDASYAAEMESAASAVIDHLMLRGARLTMVSTSSTGPLLAERFLMNTQSEHNYVPGLHYVNLGFIPGGLAGLAGFLENPAQILPYSIDGIAAWQTETHAALAPLQGITSITDFDMILLIVADPDTARMWIEQLKTYLSRPNELTSLVMVTSAQAEAVVFPYFENNPRQVHGIVSGLRGGAAYTRLTGRNTLPLKYWDAYGFGMFLAAILILIGGLTFSVLPSLTEPARKQEEVKG